MGSGAVLPVVGQRLVEGCVLLVGDVLGLAHPERLVLVQLPGSRAFPEEGALLLGALLRF